MRTRLAVSSVSVAASLLLATVLAQSKFPSSHTQRRLTSASADSAALSREPQPFNSPQTQDSAPPTQRRAASLAANYGNLPLSFAPNEGQTDAKVKFLSRGRGYSLFLTGDEAVIALKKSLPNKPDIRGSKGPKDPVLAGGISGPVSVSKVVRMQLAGANASPRVKGTDELPGKVNYFLANDPAKWRSNVPTYAKVKYENVYPGVDLVYYGSQGQLEYDFVVAPGADPRAIQLTFNQSQKLRVNADGELLLDAHDDSVRFQKPVVYQQVDEERRPVNGRFVLTANRSVSFKLGDYDSSRPLIIDPVLTYSTYLGGSSNDSGQGIAVDGSGNVYVTGYTSNFPTVNALQPGFAGGSSDAFVTKIGAGGTSVIYATYLGGSAADSGQAIAVDASGNVYLTGSTYSTNFPTVNALQPNYGGGGDAFVAKINASGSALVYSTYLGGYFGEKGTGIAVDASGNVYVTGYTGSNNFPTQKALQPFSAGDTDAFVAKINASGLGLVYSTYLGGSGNDYSNGIAIDASGNAYVTGYTYSSDFPLANAFQSTNLAAGSGGSNVFVAKVNATGSALAYSTYLGGAGNVYGFGDYGTGVAVDGLSNAYVTGYTASTNFPTANPVQPANAGGFDVFVSKLNATGSALVYSTYLGGSADDYGSGVALDVSGNAYVTGFTYSANFPTAAPIQAANRGGSDVFLAKLNPDGSTLSYSTYLGGSNASGGSPYDYGYGVAVDGFGNAFLTGLTQSNDFPTANALQVGGGTAFVAEVGVTQTTTGVISSLSPSNQGQPVTFTATVTPQGGGTPTGTVAFLAGAIQLGEVSLSNSGQAALTTSAVPPTTQNVSAQFSGDASFGPSTATVSQTVIGPLVSLSPSGLTFGPQLYGTTSSAQVVTVKNTGNADLHITAVNFAGLNPEDFTETDSCVSVAITAGQACQINVRFAPKTEGGLRSASLSLTDDAYDSPQVAGLTGTGTMPLVRFPSGASLSFGNQGVGTTSAAQTLTLQNNGNSPLIISSVTVKGLNPGDFAQVNLCPVGPTSLAVGATCTIKVTFTPTTQGSRYATLTIKDNVAMSPQTVGLDGTGAGQQSAAAPTVMFLGGGAPALFQQLGRAAVNLNGGTGTACVWTQSASSGVIARDNRTNPPSDDQGDFWAVWSPGTGTCDAPAGDFTVYSYMSLDTVGADRCYFEVDSSGVPGCVQLLSVAPESAGSNLLCYPNAANCSYFGDTGGIPASILSAISNQHWFAAGTDILPADAKFATYRALSACGLPIWRQPFDQLLRGTYGLGYQTASPGVGTPVQSYYSSASARVLDFNIGGNDPLSGLPVPDYSASTVGAQPIVVAVSPAGGTGIGAATDIPSYVLMSFYNGSLGRATDLLGPTEPNGVTSLVPEPVSGAYNVFEWSSVNNSQFHDSQDAYNCNGNGVFSNPLNLQSLNGQFADVSLQQYSYRRRVIGANEMVAQLQAGTPADQRLGYFFWSANNAANFTPANGKYLTVNGVDPLQDAYTDGVLPGADDSHPLSNVTFKWLNMGDYPIWSALRVVSPSPTPAGVTNLIQAAQELSSIQNDFIPAANLNIWHSHYYLPAINSNTAANGSTINVATPDDLCPGNLPEYGGDAGGATILKQANHDFCTDFGNITGLVNKSN